MTIQLNKVIAKQDSKIGKRSSEKYIKEKLFQDQGTILGHKIQRD